MDFDFKVYKKHGHKWLLPIFRGSALSEICIDGWFSSVCPDSVFRVTAVGFLPLSQFSFSCDVIGNYVLHFPTCFGYISKRCGLLRAGNFHSYFVLRPSYVQSLLADYIGF